MLFSIQGATKLTTTALMARNVSQMLTLITRYITANNHLVVNQIYIKNNEKIIFVINKYKK
jgi:hypothetical protein